MMMFYTKARKKDGLNLKIVFLNTGTIIKPKRLLRKQENHRSRFGI